MNKHKSSSFHENQTVEVENASLKMRNMLLEDALSKVVRIPGHARNPSAPNSAKPPISSDVPMVLYIYNGKPI